MRIVMLEPLGVSEDKIRELAKPFLDNGNKLVFCEKVLTEEEKIERAKDADVFIIANAPLTANVINAAENLKMVSVAFTGVDHVDLDACKAKGVTVCNAQGYATDATAELAISLMLASLRNIVPLDKLTKEGKTKGDYKHNQLKGKTLGVVGTGAIGRRVAEIAKAFGCKLIGYDAYESQEARDLGIEYVELNRLFEESDIVTLHAPLLESTRHIANEERIGLMKPTAILINAARGPLVDSEALAKALNEGKIAKAAVDVYEMEPPIPTEHPLLNAKNIVTTPHIAFFSEESIAYRAEITCDNITAWMNNKPQNVKL